MKEYKVLTQKGMKGTVLVNHGNIGHFSYLCLTIWAIWDGFIFYITNKRIIIKTGFMRCSMPANSKSTYADGKEGK